MLLRALVPPKIRRTLEELEAETKHDLLLRISSV